MIVKQWIVIWFCIQGQDGETDQVNGNRMYMYILCRGNCEDVLVEGRVVGVARVKISSRG